MEYFILGLSAAAAAVSVAVYWRFSALTTQLSDLKSDKEAASRILSEQLALSRQESATQAKDLREEVSKSSKGQLDSMLKGLDSMRETIQQRLRELQQDNSQKLEQMRQTVDEKLQSTLERRLSDSFKLVSERLEAVQRGLGEMSQLATGVGNLSRLLTNVKTTGVWGEGQLRALLEELLTPEQFVENVKTREDSDDVVEFAIVMPGPEESTGSVLLPIDSKFPTEVYQRLSEAREKADPQELEASRHELERALKTQAKKVNKYLNPPKTTPMAIMFLATESLYAEAMQLRGVSDEIRREHRVVICGPSTFAAILSALRMGFQTVAISKRSSEVWTLLGAIKTEFGKFGEILEATKKKLDQATQSIETAARKTRGIEKKLKKVEEIPSDSARILLSDIDIEPADVEPISDKSV